MAVSVHCRYHTEQRQHWVIAVHLKRGLCVILMLLLFSVTRCVADICPLMKTFISLKPAPVIIKKGINNIVTIHCAAIDDSSGINALNVGIVNKRSNALYSSLAGTSPVAKDPLPVQDPRISPDGKISLSGNRSCISLVISEASLRDISHTWICASTYIRPVYCFQNVTAVFEAIPHPGVTTLIASPTKNTYDSDDKVSLNCRAFYGLRGRTNSLEVAFQYYDKSQWLAVQVTDSQKYLGITAGRPTLKGDFILKSYSLHVRVSGIPLCSRRFRCFLYYGSHVFNDSVAEREVRVTRGSGHCISPSPGSPGSPSHTPATNDQDYYDTEDEEVSSDEDDTLLLASVITGVLVFAILTAVIVVVIRRREGDCGGHRRGHSRGHSRSSLGRKQETIQVVVPPSRPTVPVAPDPYSFVSQDPSSYYSAMESEVDYQQESRYGRPSFSYGH